MLSKKRYATIHPLASTARIAGFFAALKLLLHVAVNAWSGYGYFRDEFYYIVCGERLAWGYVDHPPMIAVIARATSALLGDSLVAIRLPSALAGAALIVLVVLMARELGGGHFAQALAALAALVTPPYLAANSILSTVPFDHLWWALVSLLALRLLNSGDRRWWLAIGAALGAGLMTKHTMSFLAVGVAVGVLLTPTRADLRTRWPWLAALLATLVVLPHLGWQAQHGWPTLEFSRNAAATKNAQHNPLAFLLDQIVSMHPLLFPLWLAGLVALLREQRYRLLAWLYLVPCALFAASGAAKIDYISPAFAALFAAGAVATERAYRRWAARGRGRWLPAATLSVLVLGALPIVPAVLPVLPPPLMARYAQAIGLMDSSFERGKTAPLPQFYADRFGWQALTATVAQVYRALPPDEQRQAVIFTGNYGEASALWFFGRAAGLPPTISGHNNYFLWGPGATAGSVVIVVDDTTPAELGQLFSSVEQAATNTCDYCMSYENNRPVFVARGPKVPLQTYWPQVKRYQ